MNVEEQSSCCGWLLRLCMVGPRDGITRSAPIPGELQIVAPAGSVFMQDTRCWHSSPMTNLTGAWIENPTRIQPHIFTNAALVNQQSSRIDLRLNFLDYRLNVLAGACMVVHWSLRRA